MYWAATIFLICLHGILAQKYTDKYNVEVDAVLKSERLLKNYLDCLLDKGACTPAGEELKKNVPDALQNECSKCSDDHRKGIRKVMRHLIEHKPEWFKLLQDKFDPTGEYKKKYQHYLDQDGLKY